MFIVLLPVSGFILLTLIFLSYRQCKILKKKYSKVEFELVHEKQKYQIALAELAEFKKKLEQQTLFDSLTELPSRQVWEDRVNQVLSQSKRFQLTFAVMFLNIDQFKMMNDVFGYEKSDVLLREAASRLQSCIRQVDTMSRFSDDNFVFVITQLHKPETIVFVAKRLLEAFSQPFRMNEDDFFVSANIGIAIHPSDGDDVVTLLKNANSALTQAKIKGRHTYQFYHQEMHCLSQRELILNSSLLNPTVFQDFFLYYRPEIHLETEKMLGVEVVLQWQHADFGLVAPVEFFRLAENSGRMLEIGEWIFHRALMQFKAWHQQGIELQKISIPVSWRQLESTHFVYKISQILQELNVDPAQLVLEMSEETLVLKLEHLSKTLSMLKHLGVQIAIAHFGAGHLSLQHIQKLPIDRIKIDQSLVRGITVKQESEAIVRMIIAIANSLNIVIISELVEQEKQKSLLKELGCYRMQGPLLSAHELEKSIEEILH